MDAEHAPTIASPNESARKKREAMLHQIQHILYERVRFGPIWEYIWPSGIGPWVAEAALLAGVVKLLSPWMDEGSIVPLYIGCLTLPAFVVANTQDGIARAHDWMRLGLMPQFIVRQALIIGITAGAVALGALVPSYGVRRRQLGPSRELEPRRARALGRRLAAVRTHGRLRGTGSPPRR